MKKTKFILGLFIICLMVLTSCKKKSYKIVFDSVGGSSVPSQSVLKNELLVRPSNPSKEGYRFDGWYKSTSYTDDDLYDFSSKVTSDFTLYAKWVKENYTISYNLDGGSFVDNVVERFEYGDEVILPIPVKEGYTFMGWYENDQLIEVIENRNYELYAKWSQNEYLVLIMLDDDTVYKEYLVKANETITLPEEPVKEGYKFLGWMVDENLINSNSYKVTGNVKIFAKWEKIMYTIYFATRINEDFSIRVAHGDKIEMPKTLSREGYELLGWTYIGVDYDLNTPVTKDMTLVAKWEMKKEYLEEYLNKLIPSETSTNIKLFEYLDDCSATFVWSSSNEKSITSRGEVVRFPDDVMVTLSVQVIYSDHQYQLDFKVKVNKIALKPLIKGKIVSGYLYASGGAKYLSDKALEQLDCINYSFATISSGEAYVSSMIRKDVILSYREKGVRVVLAIGGWGAGGFSDAMLTAQGRTKLVDSIMNLIKTYQFDGIDIDWEYPTSSAAGIDHNANDRENLNLFCKELKEKMLKYRKDLILTMAVVPTPQFFDFNTLDNYVDFFNVMTYDFSISSTVASHDSALYTTTYSSSSVDSNVTKLKQYISSDKIIPGAAFYARYATFASSNSQTLGSKLTKAMSSSIAFSGIMNLIGKGAVEDYDDKAKAAYLIYNNVFYTYDNPRSIMDKCKYVKDNNLAGLMCWELSQDYVDDDGTSILIDAMYNGLK